ncbi:LOW QUALITY PROTEIN: hypothetical protein M8C21_006951, partial [Ambrosia artemisiifolia]
VVLTADLETRWGGLLGGDVDRRKPPPRAPTVAVIFDCRHNGRQHVKRNGVYVRPRRGNARWKHVDCHVVVIGFFVPVTYDGIHVIGCTIFGFNGGEWRRERRWSRRFGPINDYGVPFRESWHCPILGVKHLWQQLCAPVKRKMSWDEDEPDDWTQAAGKKRSVVPFKSIFAIHIGLSG